ncbi:DinB family protein [Gramella sp. BOM4]|nr:DinB family protein [Christiangramia bathymodioli]
MNNWIERIDRNTESFQQTFGNLNSKSLNWKTDAQSWSIGENIQHLIQINESYFPIFEELEKGRLKLPFMAKLGFMVSFFGNLILKSVEPSRKKKMKTFPVWDPKSSELSTEIISQFESSQSRLKSFINDLAGEIRTGKVIYSPANRNIVYRIDTALDIIILHQQRHFYQAKEVLDNYNSEA